MKLSFEDFRKWSLDSLPKDQTCEYDHGYRDGVEDTLKDIESWLYPSPGLMIEERPILVQSYDFVYEQKWIQFKSHFFANGEEYFITVKQNGKKSLSIPSVTDHGMPYIEDVHRKILKSECNGHTGEFYILLDVGFPLEFFRLGTYTIGYRTCFDIRTKTSMGNNARYCREVPR